MVTTDLCKIMGKEVEDDEERLLTSDDVVPEQDDELGDATILSTFLNLCNNIVGAGILSLPHTFKSASIVGGITLILVTCVLSTISMILIAVCCDISGLFTYKDLFDKGFGSNWGMLIQIIMFSYTSLSGISFLILIGDFLSGNSGIIHSLCYSESCTNSIFYQLFSERIFIIPFVAITVLAPLSFMKDLHSLRYTSLVSAFSTVLLVIFLLGSYLSRTPSKEIEVFEISTGWFEALPIINVAFICHYNTPKYYQELKDRSLKRFTISVCLAFGCCCLVYILVGYCGYLLFGDNVNGDVLTNFSSNNNMAIIVRVALALVVTFTYPMAFNAFRLACLSILDNLNVKCQTEDDRYRYVTILLLCFTIIPSCFLKDIAVVLDYKGATFGGFIGLGFPALLYFYLSKDYVYKIPLRRKLDCCAILFVIWTIITSILGVAVTTWNLVNKQS